MKDYFVKPKTFLVGQTNIDLQVIEDYLRYTNNEEFLSDIEAAKQEGISTGEILCSFYAKLCYKSLTVGKNSNITRTRGIKSNLENVINTGHGCYDEKTKVLTDEGWIAWKDVVEDTKFATLNQNGNIEYHKPTNIFKYKYDGKMYQVDSHHVNLLVTPNHRMYVCKTTTKEGRKRNNYEFILAEELDSKSHCYLKSGNWTENSSLLFPNGMLQLLGFTIGDGSISKDSKKVKFKLRKSRKITYLNKVCNKLGWLLDNNQDRYSVHIPEQYFSEFLKIYNQNKEKVIPQNYFTLLSKNQLLDILDGLINSDGSVGKTCTVFDTTSQTLANQFQQLCLHCGYAANLERVLDKNQRIKNNSFGKKPLYRMGIIKGFLKPEVNKFKGSVGKTSWINYSGMVYCAEVPNNTLYVKRDGKPVWCGNSVLEHCSLNFITTDTSRIFSHELVRHRAGFAFSQTSGRYVRLDDVRFILPPELENCQEELQEFLQYTEEMVKRLEKKTGLTEEKDFKIKKKITSAIRRIAPNGLANEIGWSVNLRALRHVIEMRTSRHAEWEIRYVFNEVADIVTSKWPHILYGAQIEEVDGLKEYTNLRV